MTKILWVKFGWSEFYRGGPVDGNFSYLAGKGKQGHEAYNFAPAPDGTYYCYVPPQTEFYAPKHPDRTGWTVVCLAKHPKRKGVHIVGWYEDATLLGRWRDVPDTRARPPFADTDQGEPLVILHRQARPRISCRRKSATCPSLTLPSAGKVLIPCRP